MDRKTIEKQMMEKYGFNHGWLVEGCFHVTPPDLVSKVEKVWDRLSDVEREHMAVVYEFPGGCFELKNELSKDGKNALTVNVKAKQQLICELWFAGVKKDFKKYGQYLKENGETISALDKRILLGLIDELKSEKEHAIV